MNHREKVSSKEAFKALGSNSKDTCCKVGRWVKRLGPGLKAGAKALAKEMKEKA